MSGTAGTTPLCYKGIWESKNWPKVEALLRKEYNKSNVNKLFSLQGKADVTPMVTRLMAQFGETPVYGLFLPAMQALALSSRRLRGRVFPMLVNHQHAVIELTQSEAACIFACSFLCLNEGTCYGRPESLVAREMEDHGANIFPDVDFRAYWCTSNDMMYRKTLFYVRYTLKCAIRMGLQGKLITPDHASFLCDMKRLSEAVEPMKMLILPIYNFDKELRHDKAAPQQKLRIWVEEFDPTFVNPSLEYKSQDEKDALCDTLISFMGHADAVLVEALMSRRRKARGNVDGNDNDKQDDVLASLFNPEGGKGESGEDKYADTLRGIVQDVFVDNEAPVDKAVLGKNVVHCDSISDQQDAITTNFANKVLGGGCMSEGCVQEEILVLEFPEIMVARLFVRTMRVVQSICMTGCERFTKSSGYAFSLQYGGPIIKDPRPRKSPEELRFMMAAVDAIAMPGLIDYEMSPTTIFREFLKFLVGVQGNRQPFAKYPEIATGKWGCGAFGGHVPIKFLIQFVACMLGGIRINFSSFNDEQCKADGSQFFTMIKKMTTKKNVTKGDLFNTLFKIHIPSDKKDDTKFVFNEYLKELSSLIERK